MESTAKVVLIADTSKGINAFRAFNNEVTNNTKGLSKLSKGFTELGSASGEVVTQLAGAEASAAISKVSNLGIEIAVLGTGLRNVVSGLAKLGTSTLTKLGTIGLLLTPTIIALKELWDQKQANDQLVESTANLDLINDKLVTQLQNLVKIKVAQGEISRAFGEQILQKAIAAERAGNNDPTKINQGLMGVIKGLPTGIGDRKTLEFGLEANQARMNIGDRKEELILLRERQTLLLQMGQNIDPLFSGGSALSGGINPASTKEALDDQKALLKVIEDQEKTRKRIQEVSTTQLQLDAQSTAGTTLTTAVGGLGEALTGLITASRNWADTWRSVTSSIISGVLALILKYTILLGVLTLLDIVTGGTSGFVGGLAKSAGVTLAGHAAGGYTGDLGTNQIAGLVHGREYVMPAPAVQRIGLPALEGMRQGISTSSGSPAMHAYFFDNRMDMMNAMEGSPRAEKWVIDVINRNSHRFQKA